MKLIVGINKIILEEKDKLNAGEYNIHEVVFEFDDVYNGLIKKAVFSNTDHAYLVEIVDNKAIIPYEVLENSSDIGIGAYGYETNEEELVLRYSPSPVYVHIDLGSYKDNYDNYKVPTADVIEQLTKQIEQASQEIQEAIATIDTYDDRINTNASNIADLNNDLNDVSSQVDTNISNISDLQNNKVDKVEGKDLSTNDYTNEEKTKLASLENYDDTEIKSDIDELNQATSELEQDIIDLGTNKADKTEIPTKTSDLTNDSGFIDKTVSDLDNYIRGWDLAPIATTGDYNDLINKPTIPDVSSFITKDVNNLTNYTLKTSTGSLIDLSIDSTNYVVTLLLKDVDGNVISTDTIDLPLENVVVSGRYDNTTKKVILTLENGSEVDFSVADLVAGLQTEITIDNKLASDLVDDSNSGNKFTNTTEKQTWNNKYDKPISGIPKTDLESDVQTSLGLADTALQSHQDLSDYVTKTTYPNGSGSSGVVKFGNSFMVNNNGIPYASNLPYSQYQQLASNNEFISKGTLENVIEGKELVNATQLATKQDTLTAGNNITIENNVINANIDLSSYATIQYVDDLVGDIATILDTIQREVI